MALKASKGGERQDWVCVLGLGCCLQTLALPFLDLGTDLETEGPGCRDGSVTKALFALLEDQSQFPASMQCLTALCSCSLR